MYKFEEANSLSTSISLQDEWKNTEKKGTGDIKSSQKIIRMEMNNESDLLPSQQACTWGFYNFWPFSPLKSAHFGKLHFKACINWKGPNGAKIEAKIGQDFELTMFRGEPRHHRCHPLWRQPWCKPSLHRIPFFFLNGSRSALPNSSAWSSINKSRRDVFEDLLAILNHLSQWLRWGNHTRLAIFSCFFFSYPHHLPVLLPFVPLNLYCKEVSLPGACSKIKCNKNIKFLVLFVSSLSFSLLVFVSQLSSEQYIHVYIYIFLFLSILLIFVKVEGTRMVCAWYTRSG